MHTHVQLHTHDVLGVGSAHKKPHMLVQQDKDNSGIAHIATKEKPKPHTYIQATHESALKATILCRLKWCTAISD